MFTICLKKISHSTLSKLDKYYFVNKISNIFNVIEMYGVLISLLNETKVQTWSIENIFL